MVPPAKLRDTLLIDRGSDGTMGDVRMNDVDFELVGAILAFRGIIAERGRPVR